MALRGGECKHNNGVLTITCLFGRKRVFPLLWDVNALVLGIIKCLQILHWLGDEKWERSTQQRNHRRDWPFPVWDEVKCCYRCGIHPAGSCLWCSRFWGILLFSFTLSMCMICSLFVVHRVHSVGGVLCPQQVQTNLLAAEERFYEAQPSPTSLWQDGSLCYGRQGQVVLEGPGLWGRGWTWVLRNKHSNLF